jgi:hypothetical protein
MIAIEIRKGNIVKRKYYNPNPSNPTYKYEPCFVKSIGIAKIHVTESLNLKYNKLIKIDYNSIIPVQLTEEWVIKFGFIKRATDFILGEPIYFEDDNKLFTLLEAATGGYLLWHKGHSIKICKYVHKLQNLVFELEDKELEINDR